MNYTLEASLYGINNTLPANAKHTKTIAGA